MVPIVGKRSRSSGRAARGKAAGTRGAGAKLRREPASERAREPEGRGTGLRDDAARWWDVNRSDMLILGVLWLLVALIYWWLANGHVTLRRYKDEFLYWEVAQSFANGDGLTWRGVGQGIRAPLYMFLAALGFLPGWDTEGTYRAIHLLNALVMPAVVFPTFVLARRYVERKWAFAAALLSIAVAAMNYVGVVGTESLAYPVAALSLGSIVFAVARPQRRYWVAAVALLIVAVLTRTQFYAFATVLPLAILLVASFRPAGERKAFLMARKEPLLVFGGAALLIVIGLFAFPQKLLGVYESGLDYPTPTVGDLWYWLKGFTADIFIMTGIVPAIAAMALMFDRANWRRADLGALLAVTLVATAVLVAQVAWFSASNPYDWEGRHIFYERYLFYVAPLIFVTFIAFFRWGSAVPLYLAGAAAATAVALFDANHLLLPFSYDAFGVTVLADILKSNPDFSKWVGASLVAVAGVSAVILFFVTERGRSLIGAAWAAVALAAVLMLWSQGSGWSHALENSDYAKLAIPTPVDFIDQSTDADVGMLITSTDSPEMYYSTEFWNDRVTRAFVLPNSPTVYSPTCPFNLARDGKITSSGPGCGSIPHAFYLRNSFGRMTFRNLQKSVEPTAGVRLIVASPPARLAGLVDGREISTGTVNGKFVVRTFAAPGSAIVLHFASAPGVRAKPAHGSSYRLDAPNGATVAIPVKPGDTSTEIQILGAGDAAESAVLNKVELREPGANPIDLTA